MEARMIVLNVSFGIFLGLAGPARAEEKPPSVCPICHRANDQASYYPARAGTTLARGAMNTAFGWTELLIQPSQEVKTGGNLIAGIGNGVGQAAKRTFLGIGEIFTCWLPKGQRGYLSLNTDCPICMGTHHAPPPAQNTLDKRP